MKPLSEKVKELRVLQQEWGRETLEGEARAVAHDCWKIAADELEAWLREADEHVALRIIRAVPPALTPLRLDSSNQAYEHVREELLGTTRQEGEK